MYTRAQYLAKEVSHQDYYLELAKLASLPTSAIPLDKVKAAREAGDEHLNTIDLPFWERLAVIYKDAIAHANKKRGEVTNIPLLAGICAFKALAIHLTDNPPVKPKP